MKKIEEINVGDTAELNHLITEEDIEKFVDLTGDDNKLHIDREFAHETPFKKPVVHGMLGASFISTLIGTKMPGDGALWMTQNLEFLLPVRIGDELTIKAEVIKKNDHHKIIDLQTDIYNQNKQKVLTGTNKIKLVARKPTTQEDGRKQHKKIALVVGASGGIGRATCLRLAREGFDVAVHYNRNDNSAKRVKEEVEQIGQRSIFVKADITENPEVKEMIEQVVRHFETITVLINCATIKVSNVRMESLVWEDIQKHLDINIKGSFNLLKQIVPIMEKEKYGNIINLTTIEIESPSAQLTPYITAKSALNGFSKSLALELAPKGIRINMVSPGMTDTDLISDIPEKAKLLAEVKTPLKRLAKPEDVAEAIVFLASKSDFMTGETIRVNGGQMML